MGTSGSYPTPSGGAWTAVKTDATGLIGGNSNITPAQVLGRAVSAAGLTSPSIRPSSSGTSSGAGAGGTGRGRGGKHRGKASIGGAVAGLGGFGATLRDHGLDDALGALGLQDLAGKPAVEVVARIAEELADQADGLQAEILSTALRDAILEAAALENNRSYEHLEASLQTFINREGVEGLVVLFLTHYVFDRIWLFLESHVDKRSDTTTQSDAMATAVRQACRVNVEQLIEDTKAEGRYERVGWFGSGGQRLGQRLISDLETRLSALAPGELG